MALADLIRERPILTARLVMDRLTVSRPTALSLLRQLTGLGVLAEQASGPEASFGTWPRTSSPRFPTTMLCLWTERLTGSTPSPRIERWSQGSR